MTYRGIGATLLGVGLSLGCGGKSGDSSTPAGGAGGIPAAGGTAGSSAGGNQTASGGTVAAGGTGGTAGTSTAGFGGAAASAGMGGQAGAAASGGVGGTTATGGAAGSAGAAGMAGTTGTGGAPLSPWGSTGRGEPEEAVSESCEAPCALTFGASDDYLPGAIGATLFYDPDEPGVATLRADPSTREPGEIVLLGFTYEDNHYGNSVWTQNSVWFIFVDDYEYEYGYSMPRDVLLNTQLIHVSSGRQMMVAFEFGDQTVRVHEVWEPRCEANAVGACDNAHDCLVVDSGAGRSAADACLASCSADASCQSGCIVSDLGMSSACADCYRDFSQCVASNCGGVCPGQGGNVCMSCEVDSCRQAFRTCSGLEHVPPGMLTYPL